MNERFVAVSKVTWSRKRGCSSKPRRDFSVTRRWQQVMNAIRWIEQFAQKKISAEFVAPI